MQSAAPPLNTMALAMPMLLIVGSFVAYHLVTKSLRADINIFGFLSLTYAVALAVTLAAWVWTRGDAMTWSGSDVALAVILGLSLVGIEAGFVLAYRAGWSIAVAPTFGNVALALVMLPIAVLFLSQKVTWQTAAGIALCASGLILMARGQS
jgi:drug/metabolite transporter (DMT)-like permease